MTMPGPIVNIVHCVDTEGPLGKESLETTFERLKTTFGIELDPSEQTLRQIQRGEIDLGGLEEDVARAFHPQKLSLKSSWREIDESIRHVTSPEYRDALPDSFGGGWIYNWHCVDHVDLDINPRQRVIGYHKVFDHYADIIETWAGCANDTLNFHYHPNPITRNAMHNATHYFATGNTLFKVLSRRIIDRRFFPTVNRAGVHTIRPDSHWFLEQFIPFDLSNQATEQDYSQQLDIGDGRFGDWRRAPLTWQPYHPSHDDYQATGTCNRWIGRCLNMDARIRYITQEDVDLAFHEAGEGKGVVLAFTNHDFRDMKPEIDKVRAMIESASRRFAKVRFRYASGRDAMRAALDLNDEGPLEFSFDLNGRKLEVGSNRPTFGSQPYLAIKLRSGEYAHDNFDFQEPFRRWTYVFDDNQFPLSSVEKIGLGSCDSTGNSTAMVFDVDSRTLDVVHH